MRYGGQADIRIEDTETEVAISICDKGPGIPEGSLQKVFDPFFRLESSRAQQTGGTGLGLGIARNIARAHGGDLILHNRSRGRTLRQAEPAAMNTLILIALALLAGALLTPILIHRAYRAPRIQEHRSPADLGLPYLGRAHPNRKRQAPVCLCSLPLPAKASKTALRWP